MDVEYTLYMDIMTGKIVVNIGCNNPSRLLVGAFIQWEVSGWGKGEG